MEKINFGEYIKERRNELNLSQQDLAKVLSCSYQAISKYENNNVNIDISMIYKLCKVLNVDLLSFFKKENSKNNELCDHLVFDNEKFSTRLTFLREKRMITQKELAKNINISSSRLSKIEKGVANIKVEEFLNLASFFNISIESFYFSIEQKELDELILSYKQKDEISDNANLLVDNLNDGKNYSNLDKNYQDNDKFIIKNLFKKPSFYIPLSTLLVVSLVLIIVLPIALFNKSEDLSSYDYSKDFSYHEDSNGIVIDGYIGEIKGEIRVPSLINDKKVYKIATNAFDNEDLFKKVIIEEGIEEIDECAFNFVSSLEEIYLPSSLKIIEGNAFFITYNLKNIYLDENSPYFSLDEHSNLYSFDKKELYRVIPNNINNNEFNVIDGVEVIKSGAFDSNYDLTMITFPSSLKKIETQAFIDCSQLSEVILNEGLTTLENSAFAGLNRILEYVYLPSSLSNMDGNPFINAPLLNDIDLSVTNPYFEKVDNIIYSEDLTTLYACPSYLEKSKLKIEEGVNSILPHAFNNLVQVDEIILPSSLNEVDLYAFNNNFNLSSILIKNGAQNFKSYSIYGAQNTNIFLEYDSIPSSFGNNFTDGKIFLNGEWTYIDDKPCIIK